MSDKYVVGDTVILDWDASADPTTLALKVTDPAGAETNYTYAGATITKNGTGDYQKTLTVSVVGVYSFVWTSTGTAAGAQDGTFTVFDDVPLTANYCSLDELKSEKGLSDSVDDAILQTSINAASRQIDGACGWRFWQDPAVVARYFHPTSASCLDVTDVLRGQGISTSTGLIVALDLDDNNTWETSLTINTDFALGPLNADLEGWPWTELDLTGTYWFTRSSYRRPTIKITAKWGWPAVPDDIAKACRIQASQLANANKAVFGVAPVVAIDGAGMRAQAWNPLARDLIRPYAKPAIG